MSNEHCGYVVEVKELRKHSNADRLQVATFFGNQTIVDMSVQVGDIGIYFPTDLQLSEEYCAVNNLVRKKDAEGKNIGGYLDPDKRNIRDMKLRNEKSEGLYMPLTSLMEFCKISDFKVGDTITVVNGHEICKKYIPRRNPAKHYAGSRVHKQKVNVCPTFFEHCDTAQLAYNLDAFNPGDEVQLTLKIHGTSGRTGYLPVRHTKRTWIDKLFNRHGKDYYEYGYITGTRRVVLAEGRQGGFYDSDDFRHAMTAKLENKLQRGEIIYYEIAGFQGPNGASIMSEVQNSKIQDKEFTKQYGPTTVFSYGCVRENGYEDTPPCCDIYVYRMTMVNEDGYVVEYSPDQIKYRCEQMGVKTVPEFCRFVIPEDVNPGEYVVRQVEKYYEGPDPIGITHVREGVVARIMNRVNFSVYKHKNFQFKVLEGLAKDIADEPDIEEAQELAEEEVEES